MSAQPTPLEQVLAYITERGEIVDNGGLAVRQILDATQLPAGVVRDRLQRLEAAGQIEREVNGKRTFRIALAGHARSETPAERPLRSVPPMEPPVPAIADNDAEAPQTEDQVEEQEDDFVAVEVAIPTADLEVLRAAAYLSGLTVDPDPAVLVALFVEAIVTEWRVKPAVKQIVRAVQSHEAQS